MSAPIDHPSLAAEFVSDQERAHWHDQALWFIRAKRDRMAGMLPEWELLRDTASRIKLDTASYLANYLEEFERNALLLGAQVHWAKNSVEHNEIVLAILQRTGARNVVKSKSMLTEECHLNPFLERHGIEVIDTDLGERIVQLRQEPPSHIVLPAIHIRKEEVGELFHAQLGTAEGATDPAYLTEAARGHLRAKFLGADAAITGVNFAVAATGGIVVCTNEGNADLGVSLPRIHIACMGIEKIIPKASDLSVFVRLLARSATGQPITTYTSHFHGPAPDGELHIVIVDNGRSSILANEHFRRSLNCIRCGACMNTCPIYRRSGGHSYRNTVPGPIGSILAPARDASRNYSLPFASSLCGSCTDVCPVKIDLHHQLLAWRREINARGILPWKKRLPMLAAAVVLRRPWLMNAARRAARLAIGILPRSITHNRWNAWGRQRELPTIPAKSFRDLYIQKQGDRNDGASPNANATT